MKKKLMTILNRAARRLLFRRVVEAVAVGTASAACAAAGVQVWLWLVWVSGPASAAVCGVMAAFGAAAMFRANVARALFLDRVQAVFLGLCFIASAVAAMAVWWFVVLDGQSLPPWAPGLVPWAWLAGGALVGAVGAVCRGVTTLQAAVHMDIRGDLSERLSTAVELANRGQDQTPLAEAVYADALDAISTTSPRKLRTWRRSRRTVGALGLTLAMCAALTFLPDTAPRSVVSIENLDDVPAAMASLTDRQMRTLKARLVAIARKSDLPASVREAIKASAAAVDQHGEKALREALEQLARAINAASGESRDQMMAEILATFAGQPQPASPGADGNDTTRTDQGPLASGAPDAGGDREKPVGVYDPLYDESEHLGRLASQGDGDTVATKTGEDTIAFDAAWRLARSRAETYIAADNTSQEYRRIIQRFYVTDR